MSDDFDAALRAMAARAAHETGDGRALVTPGLTTRTRRRRRLHDAAVAGASTAAVVGLVLAGAAVADPRPEPVGPATVAPSPTSEPTPTTDPAPSPSAPPPPPAPTPTTPPALEEEVVPPTPPPLEGLVLTAAGLGPLALGGELPAEPSAADVVRFDAEACAGTDRPARWVAAYPAGTTADGAPGAPFTVWDDGGRVTRVQVLTPGPRTAAGLGVGASLAELRAAHPEMTLLVSGASDVDVWGLRDGANSLLVEVSSDAGRPGVWGPDELDRVVAVVAMAGAPDDGYYPAWGGDVCG